MVSVVMKTFMRLKVMYQWRLRTIHSQIPISIIFLMLMICYKEVTSHLEIKQIQSSEAQLKIGLKIGFDYKGFEGC